MQHSNTVENSNAHDLSTHKCTRMQQAAFMTVWQCGNGSELGDDTHFIIQHLRTLCTHASASNAFMLSLVRGYMKSCHLPCPRCRTPLLHAAAAAARPQPAESAPLPQAALASPSRQHQKLFQSLSACRCGAPAPPAPCPMQHAANRGGIAHSFASQAAQEPLNVSPIGSTGNCMLAVVLTKFA